MGKKDKKKKAKAKDSDTHVKKKVKKRLEEDEEDLDTILNNFKKQIESRKTTVEEVCISPPSSRLYASLSHNPLNSNELFLFGGEFFDGKQCHFYSDLYRYIIDKREWRKISCPNSPGPRSSHQIVSLNGYLYLFGGEFSSSRESQFYHYKDFWKFNISAKKWEKIETKPCPSARSGHRMTAWRNFIVLFGGFYDTYVETKYYDDVWIFEPKSSKWIKLDCSFAPSPRSGGLFLPYDEGVFLYGGYMKKVLQHGKTKGIVLTDSYLLRINSSDVKLSKWEKIKVNGFPIKERSGMSGIVYKNKAFIFGGVYDHPVETAETLNDDDNDDEEDQSDSVYYNDLLIYNLHSKRAFMANIKKSMRANQSNVKEKVITEDEEDMRFQLNLMDIDEDDLLYSAEPIDYEKEYTAAEGPKMFHSIHPRYNAMLSVQSNCLFIYGGKFEREEREFTLDDMYRISLDRIDGFECLQYSKMEDQEWFEEEDNSDDEADDGDGDEGSEDESNDGDKDEGVSENSHSSDSDDSNFSKGESFKGQDSGAIELESCDNSHELKDLLPMEKLRDYYERTKTIWNNEAIQNAHKLGERIHEKMIRANGFSLAKEYYEQCIHESKFIKDQKAIEKVSTRKIR